MGRRSLQPAFALALSVLSSGPALAQDREKIDIRMKDAAAKEAEGRYGEALSAFRALAEDTETAPEVKETAAARVAALAAKQERGWLALIERAAGTEIFVDGQAVKPSPDEMGLAPGRHLLEVRERPEIRIQTIAVEAAKRTTVSVAAPQSAERARLAAITLEDASRQHASLSIDGCALRDIFAGAYREIWIQPGDHRLEVEDRAAGRRGATVRMDAGASVSLVDLFATVATPLDQEDDPGPGGRLGSSRTYALIVGGAAVVAGVLGTFFLIGANHDRSVIANAPVEGGQIVGLSMREAQRFEDEAKTDTLIGSALLGGGAALLVGAGVLWLND